MSDSSITESVSNYRNPFMMKENNYDNSNGNLSTLKNTSEIVSEEEIKEMNLSWKNLTMISFSAWGKKFTWFFYLGICGYILLSMML